jgi:hypothetical protein
MIVGYRTICIATGCIVAGCSRPVAWAIVWRVIGPSSVSVVIVAIVISVAAISTIASVAVAITAVVAGVERTIISSETISVSEPKSVAISI